MGIENIFNIGSTGLAANRLAMEVTSENTANVNTPGYTRQRLIMETGPSLITAPGSFGTGVRAEHIQRAYDGMLQSQLVTGNGTDGKNQTVLRALKGIEPAFNELATSGLGQAITDFFGAWQDLTTNPGGIPERQAVITRGQILVDNFHQINTTLNQAINNADNSLSGISADIFDKAKNIAMLNGQINQTSLMGGNPNELLSQRDYLVQQLATKVGITVSPSIIDPADPQPITITLTGGQTLVNGVNYAEVYTATTGSNTPLNDVFITAAGNPPVRGADTEITDTIGGPATNPNSLGEIGGALKIRGSATYPGIVDGYLSKLDELANQIATQVNTLHTAGFALNSTNGHNFFNPAGLTSASIAIDAGLTPSLVAAATTAAGVPGDNRTAFGIANVVKAPIAFASGTMTIEAFYNSFVSQVGVDVNGATNAADQSTAYLKQLNSLWQSNSGVSLDEELTNLIKYQQAFQGSAKLITTATEMMDTVIGLVR